MAYSAEQWNRARALFELGYSLDDIALDTKISKGQLSKVSNKQGWKKETKKTSVKSAIKAYDEKKETLDKEKETIEGRIIDLSPFEVTVLKSKLEEQDSPFVKNLIFNTQILGVIRANEALTRGTKTVMLKTADYDKEGGRTERYEPYEIPLDATDNKNYIEAVDKAAITLKVADRHAKSGDVNVQTNTQVNNNSLTVEYVD